MNTQNPRITLDNKSEIKSTSHKDFIRFQSLHPKNPQCLIITWYFKWTHMHSNCLHVAWRHKSRILVGEMATLLWLFMCTLKNYNITSCVGQIQSFLGSLNGELNWIRFFHLNNHENIRFVVHLKCYAWLIFRLWGEIRMWKYSKVMRFAFYRILFLGFQGFQKGMVSTEIAKMWIWRCIYNFSQFCMEDVIKNRSIKRIVQFQ